MSPTPQRQPQFAEPEIPDELPPHACTDFTAKFSRSQSSETTVSSKAKVPPIRTSRNVFSERDAAEFHKKTCDQNEVILLLSKYLHVFGVVAASSQCALALFLWLRPWVMVWYSLDAVLNTLGLLLSFAWSHRYYSDYLCGRSCTRCCFPVIKTATLLCSSFARHWQDKHEEGARCVYARCCCCGVCCCDDDIDWESAESLDARARIEVELMVLDA